MAPETHDTSDRLLPPERLAAPAPRAFPARCHDFHRVDAPRSSRGSAQHDRGRGVSRRPRRFGGPSPYTRFPDWGASRASSVTGVGHERGRCLPTVRRCDRASDTPVAAPSCPRSHAPSRVLIEKYRPRSFGVARGSLGRESRQDRSPRRLVKDDASFDPGCLPSAGTLRRIRWPLPRAHWPYARFDSPVPRPPHRFWRWCDRWMKLSLHPGPCVDPAPLHRCDPTRDHPFARRKLRRFTADARPG